MLFLIEATIAGCEAGRKQRGVARQGSCSAAIAGNAPPRVTNGGTWRIDLYLLPLWEKATRSGRIILKTMRETQALHYDDRQHILRELGTRPTAVSARVVRFFRCPRRVAAFTFEHVECAVSPTVQHAGDKAGLLPALYARWTGRVLRFHMRMKCPLPSSDKMNQRRTGKVLIVPAY